MRRAASATLLAFLALGQLAVEAKRQPLRMKPRPPPPPGRGIGRTPQERLAQMNGEKGRYPAPDTLQGAKEAFYRERASELQSLGGPALERRLRDAHAPDEVLHACEKGQLVGRGGTRLVGKEALVEALLQWEDWKEDARSKPLGSLVVWARRSGAPDKAIAAALSPGKAATAARAALASVGAGHRLSTMIRGTDPAPAPSVSTLAADAEALLRLKPPQTEQAQRLYTTAAGLCSSATELKELRSHHPDLADAAESNVEQFPTAAGIAERERDAATRRKAMAVRELDRGTLRDILSSQVRPTTRPPPS